MHLSRTKTAVGLLLAGLVATLPGCALNASTSSAEEGSLAENADLDGAELTVGSKEFTEQLVMCHITALALESVGASVERSCGMSGSSAVRTALTSGDVDMYWEYTGTAWINFLQHTEPLKDPAKQYDKVAAEDLEKNQVRWLDPSTANNSYSLSVKSSTAEELGVSTLSDYAELTKSDPDAASTCIAQEFAGRSDGWPGLQQAYGFKPAQGQVAKLAQGAIFNALDKGDPCNFGQTTTTDGRIKALDLTVLEDDKSFFPIYNPAVTVREDTYSEYPAIGETMNPIAAALDDSILRDLNAQVDVDGKDAEDVAEEWLKSEGFIS